MAGHYWHFFNNLKGKLTVNILDRVMFDSGEAVLKPDGAAVLVLVY